MNDGEQEPFSQNIIEKIKSFHTFFESELNTKPENELTSDEKNEKLRMVEQISRLSEIMEGGSHGSKPSFEVSETEDGGSMKQFGGLANSVFSRPKEITKAGNSSVMNDLNSRNTSIGEETSEVNGRFGMDKNVRDCEPQRAIDNLSAKQSCDSDSSDIEAENEQQQSDSDNERKLQIEDDHAHESDDISSDVVVEKRESNVDESDQISQSRCKKTKVPETSNVSQSDSSSEVRTQTCSSRREIDYIRCPNSPETKTPDRLSRSSRKKLKAQLPESGSEIQTRLRSSLGKAANVRKSRSPQQKTTKSPRLRYRTCATPKVVMEPKPKGHKETKSGPANSPRKERGRPRGNCRSPFINPIPGDCHEKVGDSQSQKILPEESSHESAEKILRHKSGLEVSKNDSLQFCKPKKIISSNSHSIRHDTPVGDDLRDLSSCSASSTIDEKMTVTHAKSSRSNKKILIEDSILDTIEDSVGKKEIICKPRVDSSGENRRNLIKPKHRGGSIEKLGDSNIRKILREEPNDDAPIDLVKMRSDLETGPTIDSIPSVNEAKMICSNLSSVHNNPQVDPVKNDLPTRRSDLEYSTPNATIASRLKRKSIGNNGSAKNLVQEEGIDAEPVSAFRKKRRKRKTKRYKIESQAVNRSECSEVVSTVCEGNRTFEERSINASSTSTCYSMDVVDDEVNKDTSTSVPEQTFKVPSMSLKHQNFIDNQDRKMTSKTQHLASDHGKRRKNDVSTHWLQDNLQYNTKASVTTSTPMSLNIVNELGLSPRHSRNLKNQCVSSTNRSCAVKEMDAVSEDSATLDYDYIPNVRDSQEDSSEPETTSFHPHPTTKSCGPSSGVGQQVAGNTRNASFSSDDSSSTDASTSRDFRNPIFSEDHRHDPSDSNDDHLSQSSEISIYDRLYKQPKIPLEKGLSNPKGLEGRSHQPRSVDKNRDMDLSKSIGVKTPVSSRSIVRCSIETPSSEPVAGRNLKSRTKDVGLTAQSSVETHPEKQSHPGSQPNEDDEWKKYKVDWENPTHFNGKNSFGVYYEDPFAHQKAVAWVAKMSRRILGTPSSILKKAKTTPFIQPHIKGMAKKVKMFDSISAVLPLKPSTLNIIKNAICPQYWEGELCDKTCKKNHKMNLSSFTSVSSDEVFRAVSTRLMELENPPFEMISSFIESLAETNEVIKILSFSKVLFTKKGLKFCTTVCGLFIKYLSKWLNCGQHSAVEYFLKYHYYMTKKKDVTNLLAKINKLIAYSQVGTYKNRVYEIVGFLLDLNEYTLPFEILDKLLHQVNSNPPRDIEVTKDKIRNQMKCFEKTDNEDFRARANMFLRAHFP